MNPFKKAGTFKNVDELRAYLAERGIDLPLADEGVREAISAKIEVWGRSLPNRWAILPMEGWDCSPSGAPSDYTRRRWLNFAISGASLIAGTEAGAVMHEGRSNPSQLLLSKENLPMLKSIVAEMRKVHAVKFGTAGDFLIGIQLTHSGDRKSVV